MLYFSKLLWICGHQHLNPLMLHMPMLIPVNINSCFWPKRGTGKGKGKGWCDPHFQAKPTHYISWYWLPSWQIELFNLLESGNSLQNGLRRWTYFTWKAALHCQHSNVPSKLRGFGFMQSISISHLGMLVCLKVFCLSYTSELVLLSWTY